MQISFDALPRLLAVLAVATTLAACASPESGSDTVANNPAQQTDRTPESAAATPTPSAGTTMGSGTTGSMQSGGPMMSGQTDKNAMCMMYRNMQGATEEQRQAMMDQQMQGMSPEMRQRHMQMMRQQCQQAPAQ